MRLHEPIADAKRRRAWLSNGGLSGFSVTHQEKWRFSSSFLQEEQVSGI
jgi:hypothetical protein